MRRWHRPLPACRPTSTAAAASIVDEPATAEALATVVLRGLGVGAFTLDDVLALAPGADIAVLRKLKERTLS